MRSPGAAHHQSPSSPDSSAPSPVSFSAPLDATSSTAFDALGLESGGGDEGGNGNQHRGRGGDSGDGGDDDEDALPADAVAVLTAASRSASSISPDVRAAVAAGRVGADVLARVLAVEAIPLLGGLAGAWPGLRNRLVANSRLPLQMGVELTVGIVTKTLAEVSMRGDRFWKEFDFYMSDLALEIVGDAMLVWLLSPSIMFGARARAGSLRAVLEALPKHAFQAGPYNAPQRGVALLVKGVQFAIVGFSSSLVGHSLTTALVNRRKSLDAKAGGRRRFEDHDEVVLAPVLPTSVAWGGFMFCSSNPRYQLLNGLEQRLIFPLLEGSPLLSAVVSFAARFGNCFVGGVHWIPFARFFGIQ